MLACEDRLPESVSFWAGSGKDDTMSSHNPASPGQPSPKPAPGGKTGASTKEPAIGFTRAGALWSSLIAGFVILILLLIFITQNTVPTDFRFLGWHWSLPLGVAILLAAVVGGLITVAVGTARILQLRRAAKKHHAATPR
ncbi:putative membrane protein [Mycobacterium marseillense]|uniref:Membrane protein n=2 Tax=Mycobacterium marseillense TaxID=701042 RepID=A0ABM7JGQ2_9MYCO|nr:putative membrane protein [Mycobacterium marseillense]